MIIAPPVLRVRYVYKLETTTADKLFDMELWNSGDWVLLWEHAIRAYGIVLTDWQTAIW